MKCLRCGTELKDNTVFCPECSKVTSVPLPASPYMNKKIVIPKRTPAQSMKKQDPKKTPKKTGRLGRWIFLSVFLLLLSGAMILQGAYVYNEKARLASEVARLASAEDECVRLTDKLRQATQEVNALEEELSQLASDSYLEVRNSLKDAEKTIESLTSELTRAQITNSDLESQIELLREKTEFFDAYIVFLQEDNTNIFHSYDCEKFTHNGYRAYNKQQALSLGYSPCPDCQ